MTTRALVLNCLVNTVCAIGALLAKSDRLAVEFVVCALAWTMVAVWRARR